MGFIKGVINFCKNLNYTPDFSLPEYDNWLKFLNQGGTSAQWEYLKTKNHWNFVDINAEIREGYLNDVEPISDKYFTLLEKIQNDWSVLYNLKDYDGPKAELMEKDCIECIRYYKMMQKIDRDYGELSPVNVPAFKRLAMLYEKQKRYEDSVSICTEALRAGAWGDGMQGRLVRMIKKTGRAQTEEETILINKDFTINRENYI